MLNRSLRLGVDLNSPYVNPCVLNLHNCPDPGIVFQLVIFLLSLMEWNIQLPILVPNATTPGGLIGMLERDEIDMIASLSPIPYKLDELKRVDYSLPITTLEYGFVVLSLPPESNPLWNLLVPFSKVVWIFVALTTFIVQLVWRWFLWLSSTNSQLVSGWTKQFLLITKGFFFLFLILKFYRSNLYRFFVASDPPVMPFNSYEEFTDSYSKGDVKFAIWDYSALGDINSSTLPVDKLFRSTIFTNPVRVIPEDRDMYRTVANNPDLTFRTSFTSYLIKTSNWRFPGTEEKVTYCNLSFVSARRTFQSFAFQKDSHLLEPFNQVLYSISHSAEEWDIRLIDRQIPPRRCGNAAKTMTKKYFPLGLKMLYSSFFMWALALLTASVIFFCESISAIIYRTASYQLRFGSN